MDTNLKNDITYLAQQSTSNLNIIISSMTALLNDSDDKIETLENQTWFQRMCKTISGKNRMTKEDIKHNHNKINAYVTCAITELFEQQCIDRQIIMSLGNQLNVLCMNQIQLKQMLGSFVSKLNEKIESVDNFHILSTEISQGVYSELAPIVAIGKILSQIDNRSLNDYRKMNILKRSMFSQKILNDEQFFISDYLMEVVNAKKEDIGILYAEMNSLYNDLFAKIIIEVIEQYHFLPELARKLKDKQAIIENVISDKQLDKNVTFSIEEFFDDFINSKLEIINNLALIPTLQNDSRSCIEEAENLFIENKLDEAFDIFQSLAKEGNGRAMYFMGEYYSHGYGSINIDDEEAKKWRKKGQEKQDVLSTLNVAFSLHKDDPTREKIFKDCFDEVLYLAESGDVFAQNELGDLYFNGQGTQKNIKKGIEWYTKSADKDYWRSACKLGVCYYNGLGVEKNCDLAIKWFEKATALKDSWAMYNLGYLYYLEFENYCSDYYGNELDLSIGRNRLLDTNKGKSLIENSKKWLNKAIEFGEISAYSILGDIYYYQYSDYTKGKELYLKGAELGDNVAQYKYASYCALDDDYFTCVKFMKLAASNGNADAKKWLGVNREIMEKYSL